MASIFDAHAAIQSQFDALDDEMNGGSAAAAAVAVAAVAYAPVSARPAHAPAHAADAGRAQGAFADAAEPAGCVFADPSAPFGIAFGASPLAYASALSLFQSEFNEEQAQERSRRRIRTRERVITEPNPNKQCMGDLRLLKLRWYLSNTGFSRSADQVNFHEHFIQACLPLIFGDEWDKNSVRVMKQFKITELKSEVLCMTPRRFGKSWAIAMFVIAMMLAVPGVKLAVFSPGKRASDSLMKLVLKFSNNIKGARARIIGANTEHLYIAARELGDGIGMMTQVAKNMQSQADTSELSCFPSSKKGETRPRSRSRCMLHAACCILYTVYCILCTAYCVLCSARCAAPSARREVSRPGCERQRRRASRARARACACVRVRARIRVQLSGVLVPRRVSRRCHRCCCCCCCRRVERAGRGRSAVGARADLLRYARVQLHDVRALVDERAHRRYLREQLVVLCPEDAVLDGDPCDALVRADDLGAVEVELRGAHIEDHRARLVEAVLAAVRVEVHGQPADAHQERYELGASLDDSHPPRRRGLGLHRHRCRCQCRCRCSERLRCVRRHCESRARVGVDVVQEVLAEERLAVHHRARARSDTGGRSRTRASTDRVCPEQTQVLNQGGK
jgi:hypothetical protein